MAQRDPFRSSPTPWISGRIIGPKPACKPGHVWAIRQQLKTAGRVRDLALFDCGIDAKLRGCDLVRLRVSDVAPGGSLRQRATVIQQKTGGPIPFEITDATRDALAAGLAIRGRRQLGRHDRPRTAGAWDPQPAANEACAGVQEDGQPSSVPAPARSQETREHRPLSRHRRGRRPRPFRTGGSLKRAGGPKRPPAISAWGGERTSQFDASCAILCNV